jgi:hypothetical protein
MAGQRHRYILATKTPARDRAAAQRHLALSLSRLRTDYLDLWQFHNVSSFEAYGQVLGPGGAMEAARKAQEEGVVRHIGITSHSMDVALQAVASGMFETIQFPFNFVTDEAAERLLPLAQANDVGFIAMKPFAGGLLGNARLAIKYLLQFDNVLPDPGIEIVEEIEQIVEIVDGPWALSPEERIEMERVRAEVGTRFCRRCGYCEPCPQGVHISTIMNLRSFWKRFPAERFTTGWIAEAVTSAESCIHCGECEEKCPYHLPIQEMLEENQAFFERASSV